MCKNSFPAVARKRQFLQEIQEGQALACEVEVSHEDNDVRSFGLHQARDSLFYRQLIADEALQDRTNAAR